MRLTKGFGSNNAIRAKGAPVRLTSCQQSVAGGGLIAKMWELGINAHLHVERLCDRNIGIATRLVGTVRTPMPLNRLSAQKLHPKPLVTYVSSIDSAVDTHKAFVHTAETRALKVLTGA